MADIIKPENVNAAVMPLPTHQTPYGEECCLTKQFQSILFHYDLRQSEVDILEEEEIFSVSDARYADPDGDVSQRDCFEGGVSSHRVFGWVVVLRCLFARLSLLVCGVLSASGLLVLLDAALLFLVRCRGQESTAPNSSRNHQDRVSSCAFSRPDGRGWPARSRFCWH